MGKLYSPKKVGVATFLGGLLAGGYLLFKNYRTMGEDAKANKAMLWCGLGLLILVLVGMFIDFPGSSAGITAGTTSALYLMAKTHQGDAYVAAHEQGEGLLGGWLSTIGISLAGLIVTLLLMFPLAIVLSPFLPA